MKTSEAIRILESHNKWRRGDDEEPTTHLEELGLALEHAIAHMKRYQWKPIETAPRDGSFLLVAGKSCLDDEKMYVCEASGSRYGFETYQGMLKNQPTQWMPLPQFEEDVYCG